MQTSLYGSAGNLQDLANLFYRGLLFNPHAKRLSKLRFKIIDRTPDPCQALSKIADFLRTQGRILKFRTECLVYAIRLQINHYLRSNTPLA
jgi:hypothetical protein